MCALACVCVCVCVCHSRHMEIGENLWETILPFHYVRIINLGDRSIYTESPLADPKTGMKYSQLFLRFFLKKACNLE